MKKVFTAQDGVLVSHLKNLLESNDIRCCIMNNYLSGAVGEVPPQECWPQLWVLDEMRLAEANDLIQEFLKPPPKSSPWKCDNCGEVIEAQFTECWQCGNSRISL